MADTTTGLDSLNRLAARASGAAAPDAFTPRLPSRFEPLSIGAPEDSSDDAIEQAGREDQSTAAPAHSLHVEQPPERQSRHLRESEAPRDIRRIADDAVRPVPQARGTDRSTPSGPRDLPTASQSRHASIEAPAPPSRPAGRGAAPAAPALEPARPRTIGAAATERAERAARPDHAAIVREPAVRRAAESRTTPAALVPMARPSPNRLGADRGAVRGDQPRPVVHVTIGRVEIRAANAAAANARSATRSPAPSSLDGYLQRRQMGGRS